MRFMIAATLICITSLHRAEASTAPTPYTLAPFASRAVAEAQARPNGRRQRDCAQSTDSVYRRCLANPRFNGRPNALIFDLCQADLQAFRLQCNP